MPTYVREVLRARGEPLPTALREHFEPYFGGRLPNVRVHKGREARAAGFALGAHAFAAGDDIAWPDSAPEMHSPKGRQLLAHELTHVMQQRFSAHAGMDAGSAVSEREAQDAAAGHAMGPPAARLTPTRWGLALSVDEFIGATPDLASRSYSQLVEDADQISEWLGRQISTTPESMQLEDALQRLRAEIGRRNKNVAAKALKPGRHAKANVPTPDMPPTGTVGSDDRPRVLIERSSPDYRDADERKQQLDKIVAWMQRTDVNKADRDLLRIELGYLAPGYEKDRVKAAGERRAQVIQKAIAMPADGDKSHLMAALHRIEDIRPLAGSPGLHYLMDGHEMIVMADATVAQLMAKTLAALDQAASKARSMNEYTFARAKDFVKVNDDHEIVGFVVSTWSGKNPYDMWEAVLPLIQRSNMAATRYLDMRKSANASLVSEAAIVLQAAEEAQRARQLFNETFDGAMDAADSIVNGLEIVRDVSFTVVLVLGAAIAAPVVAAGVSGLGATGTVAGGLTIAGTSGVVGTGGALLGGGSTLLAGGSMDEAQASAWKWGKRGISTGAAGGTAQVLGSALNVGATGLSTADKLVRLTASQAGGNFVGNATGTLLEGGSAKDALVSGSVGAVTAVVTAPLGMATGSIPNPALRTVTNMTVAGGVGLGTTYALTGNTDEAWQGAATSAATAGVFSLAEPSNGPSWGQKKAYETGRGIRSSSRAYLSAAMLGMSEPNLPFKVTGATVGSVLEPQAGAYSDGTASSRQAVDPASAVAAPQQVQAQAAAHTQAAASTTASETTPMASATPVGAATQAAGIMAATASVPTNTRAPSAWTSPSTQSDADRAFAEDAAYQTSNERGFTLRQRTTGSGKQQSSLSTIVQTPAQRQATARISGQRLSGGHLAAWNATTNAQEISDMVEVNRLWNQGTPQSRQQARGLAREVFDRHVRRFWTAERRSAALRADFIAAGMRYDLTTSGAPRYLLPGGEQTGMTLDHGIRLSEDPTQALTGTNLSFVLGDENSVTLEDIRNNDPFQ